MLSGFPFSENWQRNVDAPQKYSGYHHTVAYGQLQGLKYIIRTLIKYNFTRRPQVVFDLEKLWKPCC